MRVRRRKKESEAPRKRIGAEKESKALRKSEAEGERRERNIQGEIEA